MAKAEVQPLLPHEIGILLLPGFSMLAFFAVLEPIRLANQLLGRRTYSWSVFTAEGAPARSSCGMATVALTLPEPERSPDCVIVVAGFDPWPQNDCHLKAWLRALDRRGAMLGAVDTGSFLLASAGLLTDVPTALHWESAAAFAELFPDAPLSDQLIELHPRRLLCAGGVAVLDMMLALIEREHGGALGDAIASRLIHARRPSPQLSVHKPIPADDSDMRAVLHLMEQHIEEPLPILHIAARTGFSQRSMERKFHRSFGLTPTQAYLRIRLEKAHQLLRHSTLAVREVALACGFTSIPYFCRSYKARFQMSPGGDRTPDVKLVWSGLAMAIQGKELADLGNNF